jgi:hypothetical protein
MEAKPTPIPQSRLLQQLDGYHIRFREGYLPSDVHGFKVTAGCNLHDHTKDSDEGGGDQTEPSPELISDIRSRQSTEETPCL